MRTDLYGVSPLLGHIVTRPESGGVGRIAEVDPDPKTMHDGLPLVRIAWDNPYDPVGFLSPEHASHLLSFERVVEARAAQIERDRRTIARLKNAQVPADSLGAVVRSMDTATTEMLGRASWRRTRN